MWIEKDETKSEEQKNRKSWGGENPSCRGIKIDLLLPVGLLEKRWRMEENSLSLTGGRCTKLWLEDGDNNDVSQERCVADEIRNAKPQKTNDRRSYKENLNRIRNTGYGHRGLNFVTTQNQHVNNSSIGRDIFHNYTKVQLSRYPCKESVFSYS